MARAYLGLGSNLGDREKHLLGALALLRRAGVMVGATSRLYETEPWGVTGQPPYLNAACAIDTDLPPHELLATLKETERRTGRRPGLRWGPREVDLDILLYDDLIIATPSLTIPHRGMLERWSVLVPLADIAAQMRHPATGLTIGEHLAALGEPSGIAPYPPGLIGRCTLS